MENIKFVTPSAMKTVSVSVQKVKWTDIGGSDRIRKSLRQLIEWPRVYKLHIPWKLKKHLKIFIKKSWKMLKF